MAGDNRKAGLLAVVAAALCLLGIAYNLLQEPFLASLGAQTERRRYFEQVITPKGLTLHPAEYGRKR